MEGIAMEFDENAGLDTSEVSDQRSGGGGGMLGGSGMKVGGGIGGIILLLLSIFLGVNLTGAVPAGGSIPPPGSNSESTGTFTKCTTGEANANNDPDCQLIAVTNSIQSFWAKALPAETGIRYTPTITVLYSGAVSTNGCGDASSAVGPFYCPNDLRIYLDQDFFTEMLQGQLGARGGALARAYVIAHEYGHHIENHLEVLQNAQSQRGANSDAVKIELMADCLAGTWARYASQTPGKNGIPLVKNITQADLDDAIDAAQSVGDDRIQQGTSGRVNPDGWTHGSAEQRAKSFMVGYQQGSIKTCNLFG